MVAVKLKPFDSGDLTRCWNWRNEPTARRTLVFEMPSEKTQFLGWISDFGSDRMVYIAIEPYTSQPLGMAVLTKDGELALIIDRGFRGKGYGTAAIIALCKLAHGKGVVAIRSYIKIDDYKALTALDHAGFLEDGELKVRGKECVRMIRNV